MKRSVIAILSLAAVASAFAAASTPAARLPAGTASGTLQINGHTSVIRYAYLSHRKADGANRTVITLSDVPLTADQRVNKMHELSEAAAAGTARVIVVILKDNNKVYDTTIYDNSFKPIPRMSISGMNDFDLTSSTVDRAEGHAYMKEPFTDSTDTYFYDVTFAAAEK